MSMNAFDTGLYWFGTALVFAGAIYACLVLYVVLKSPHGRDVPSAGAGVSGHLQPVSVLKPLCGAEPRLYENLRGFCVQAYPDYELIFGVQDNEDPAIDVVRQLRTEFPQLDIALVIDPRLHGSNPKVSNLINMLPHARNDWFVLADSDISVPANYLTRVAAPLADSDVGIVTCLYHGIARLGFWSRMGRLFIDDWFVPSVRLAHAFGSTRFSFGATIAVRREVLSSIGGVEALRDTLADDFWLGELTRQKSLRTVLSDLLVATEVSDAGFSTLWARELRWLRTIRSIAPLGFIPACLCFTTPIVLLGLALAPGVPNGILALLGLGARALLYFSRPELKHETPLWRELLLIPLRDGLLLLEWAVALTGWQVKWRGAVLHSRGGKGAASR
jgi:ceramide glucosyltransferase